MSRELLPEVTKGGRKAFTLRRVTHYRFPGITGEMAILRQVTDSSGGMPFHCCYFWQFFLCRAFTEIKVGAQS